MYYEKFVGEILCCTVLGNSKSLTARNIELCTLEKNSANGSVSDFTVERYWGSWFGNLKPKDKLQCGRFKGVRDHKVAGPCLSQMSAGLLGSEYRPCELPGDVCFANCVKWENVCIDQQFTSEYRAHVLSWNPGNVKDHFTNFRIGKMYHMSSVVGSRQRRSNERSYVYYLDVLYNSCKNCNSVMVVGGGSCPVSNTPHPSKVSKWNGP